MNFLNRDDLEKIENGKCKVMEQFFDGHYMWWITQNNRTGEYTLYKDGKKVKESDDAQELYGIINGDIKIK